MPFDNTQQGGQSAAKPRMRYDEDEILAIVRAERLAAVGIESGDEVFEEREKALEYFKGQMDDVASFPGRSSVVSSDVADAAYTALPDLVEIFTGGEEIGSFRPLKDGDVDKAKQETSIVNHVILNENAGFELVYDVIHDALICKVGIVYFYAEKYDREETEEFQQQSAVALQAAQEAGDDVANVTLTGVHPQTGEPLYSFQVTQNKTKTKICCVPVSPEDFAVSRDTVNLRDTPYCIARIRLRAYKLKEMGIDADLVDELPVYSAQAQEEQDLARDVAGEHSTPVYVTETSADMRLVQVHLHVVRMDADGDGQSEIWRVLTDEQEGTLLDMEKLTVVPFAGGSPYRQPHRWYGRALADLLIQIQQIKTVLMRMAMDAGHFGLNQRLEVDMTGAAEETIDDLLNNRPGAPIRVNRQGTVTPIKSGGMSYDPFEALEYVATVGEQRSGIMRAMQGLNPDTLHDTKGGMLALMAASQRRLRLVARTLAEVVFRDLFVGVHSLLREHGQENMSFPVGEDAGSVAPPPQPQMPGVPQQPQPQPQSGGGQFVTVSPTSWAQRDAFDIAIGLGGGREHDLMLLNAVSEDAKAIVEGQGGFGGVFTAQNAYELATAKVERSGLKGANKFFTNPAKQPPEPPKPDPEMMKLQAEMAAREKEMAAEAQNKAADREAQERHTQMQFQKDVQLAEVQQQDDQVRAQIDAQDKADAHQLALSKLELDRFNAESTVALKNRELDIKERELEIKERDLEVRAEEARINATLNAAKIEDGRDARAENRDEAAIDRDHSSYEAQQDRDAQPPPKGSE